MKRLLILLSIIFICLFISGCTKNSNDEIQIYNKSIYIFDDINIEIKDGFFYDNHEKFIVDDNTIGITIYFSNIDTWDNNTNDEE